MRLSRFLTIAAVSVLAATPIAANPLSRILAESGLTPQDTNLMREAEQKLLADASAGGGAKVNWQNARSGARGEVRITARRGACRVVQHQVHRDDQSEPRRLKRKFCPADGGWMLTP